MIIHHIRTVFIYYLVGGREKAENAHSQLHAVPRTVSYWSLSFCTLRFPSAFNPKCAHGGKKGRNELFILVLCLKGFFKHRNGKRNRNRLGKCAVAFTTLSGNMWWMILVFHWDNQWARKKFLVCLTMNISFNPSFIISLPSYVHIFLHTSCIRYLPLGYSHLG